MNLREFTDVVDKKTDELRKEELQCFIHSIARKVQENQREEFLDLLRDIRNMGGEDGSGQEMPDVARAVDEKEVQKEIGRLMELFEEIENEDLCLHAEGYEDYSAGHWDSDWLWEYEDPEGVCQVYADACLTIGRCINDGFYDKALELFDAMLKSEVWVENDWDDFSLGLEELEEEKLISIDLGCLALEILYAVYQVSPPERRAEEMYSCFAISFFRNVELEQMLCLGREELKGLTDFWDSWIRLLSEKNGDMEARLLKEAVLYQRGEEGILDLARTSCQRHPSMYLEALLGMQKSHEYQRQLEIGKEALERIDSGFKIRSEIALCTAQAAIQLGQEECAQQCWVEALVSDTTPINYLRLIAESSSPDQYQKAAGSILRSGKQAVIEEHSESAYGGRTDELRKNHVSRMDMRILRFLNGDFEYAIQPCQEIKKPLGWTGTFMKCGLGLFLLLLYQGRELQQGCRAQEQRVISDLGFDVEQYFKGTRYRLEYGQTGVKPPNAEEIFWQCFRRWKDCHVLDQKQTQSYLAVLEQQIDKRVKAIVSGQFRAHYASVAALAAALGEVKESLGMRGAKEEILQGYRREFPRHSSFHGALRQYGMRDTRRR